MCTTHFCTRQASAKLEAWLHQNAGHENKVLDEVIAPQNTRTLRNFLLGQLEIFLVNNMSKKSLEDSLQEYARNLGANSIIPTTIKQFKKLASFLDGEVHFYAACCAPCNRTDTTCTHCGQPVWIGKRPRHVFFVRSVKRWLEDLLRVPTLRVAIEQFRMRKQEEGVIGDVLDGEVAQDLVLKGTAILVYECCDSPCAIAGWFRREKDFCFLANWDGFLPFKNRSSKTMDVSTLSLLMLPPALRMQAELLFTWWGVSGHPSNLNPFLRVALADFFESINDFLTSDSTHSLRLYLATSDTCTAEPRLILLLASCDCPAQRQVSGERGPGAKHGCEKCHSFGWQDPAVKAAREARAATRAATVTEVCMQDLHAQINSLSIGATRLRQGECR